MADIVHSVIQGSPAAVDQSVEKYFTQYSPFGYGTRIISDKTHTNEEGVEIRIVKIQRWSSCD